MYCGASVSRGRPAARPVAILSRSAPGGVEVILVNAELPPELADETIPIAAAQQIPLQSAPQGPRHANE